jgi:hypothetical protein
MCPALDTEFTTARGAKSARRHRFALFTVDNSLARTVTFDGHFSGERASALLRCQTLPFLKSWSRSHATGPTGPLEPLEPSTGENSRLEAKQVLGLSYAPDGPGGQVGVRRSCAHVGCRKSFGRSDSENCPAHPDVFIKTVTLQGDDRVLHCLGDLIDSTADENARLGYLVADGNHCRHGTNRKANTTDTTATEKIEALPVVEVVSIDESHPTMLTPAADP